MVSILANRYRVKNKSNFENVNYIIIISYEEVYFCSCGVGMPEQGPTITTMSYLTNSEQLSKISFNRV